MAIPEKSPQSSERADIRVVYDRETGEILHVHQAIALAGIKLPNEDVLRTSAVELASRMTGRPVQQLDAVAVREEQLETGTKYKVNVQNKSLVAQQSDTAAEI
jgi:hypothetical protein